MNLGLYKEWITGSQATPLTNTECSDWLQEKNNVFMALLPAQRYLEKSYKSVFWSFEKLVAPAPKVGIMT